MVFRQWHRLTSKGLLLLSVSSLTILSFLIICSSAQDGESTIISRREAVRVRNKRDGLWSEWSAWSTCSRTCGGGITTQTRQCKLRKSKSSEAASDVSRYARNVSNRHCEGHATRHHLCNTQECPVGTIDFRESQCKAFDNRPFMGKVYQWESFIDERNPCSLTCRAKGYRFFATLNKSVIDGTPCTKPTQLDLHACISGVCMPIGCDGVAGSIRRLDMCGICGGDNSTCRLISGIFTRPQLALGYNLVANIPKGACNINITEIKISANHLALRKQDGSYIFNGDYRRPSWPGIYDGAGTKFQYTRSDLKALPETISSAGPLKEPVDLMILFQKPNPGIKYEYILPVGNVPIPPSVPLHDTPINNRLTLAATSRPGSFIRSPQELLSSGTSSILSLKSLQSPPSHASDSAVLGTFPRHHHHHHGHYGRRRGGHHHREGSNKRDSAAAVAAASAAVSDVPENPDNKKFYWKIMGYTNCSELCGGGMQRSIIRCVRAPLGNPVSDRRCTSDQEKPPGQLIRCNLKPCPAEWIVGDWSNCSTECGEGFKTREIHCQQKISPTLTMRVNEGACLKQKPSIRASCQLKSCHRWQSSLWSECSSKCGNGVRKRTVTCVDLKKAEDHNGGSQVRSMKQDFSFCNMTEKPAEIKACNMGPCDMTSEWFISDWSTECTQRCGSGLQTRHVVCSGIYKYKNSSSSESNELESNLIGDEDDARYSKVDKRRRSIKNTLENASEKNSEDFLCDESIRPDSERECYSDRACGEAVWFTGPWGDCSALCGSGSRTRQVLCIIFSRGKFKVVSDSLCPTDTKPDDKELCESTKSCSPTWFTTDWGDCTAVCGGGYQKRKISCISFGEESFPSTLCSDKNRPVEKRSCNLQKCSLLVPANTDDSGMVKDKPLEQQAAGTTTFKITAASTTSAHFRNSSTNNNSIDTNYNITAITSNNNLYSNSSISVVLPASVLTTTKPSSSTTSGQLHNEDPEAECQDQYRNCALVVQARLCRYKYYRSVCCNSCTDSI